MLAQEKNSILTDFPHPFLFLSIVQNAGPL